MTLDMPADETMTELRLLDGQEQDDFQLLICFTSFCRSCSISSINSNEPPSAEQCFTHQMDKPVQAMRAMLSTENNRLFIRPIYSPNSAALVVINPFDGHQLRASDYVHIEDHRVVASFRSDGFVYFVGSARRANLPLLVGDGNTGERTDVRLTRVCQGDTSRLGDKGLESRMELVLGCHGFEDPWHEPFPQRAIAASVSANDKFLLVLFEREKANTRRNLVCRFEMAQLEAAFERLWNKCQEVVSSSWLETQCKDAMDKPECFMFSWELNERKSLCRRFDGNLTNCGLNASLTTANHAGWLENFQPTLGTFVAELPPPESPVVVLAETATEEAILMAFKNGTIMRFAINEANKQSMATALWTIPTESSPYGTFQMAVHPESGELFFAQKNEVHFLGLDCAGMYPRCEDILWTDPMECLWCAFANTSGHTIGREEQEEKCRANKGFLLESCPPVITDVTQEESGMVIIWGQRLNTVDSPKIEFCGHPCQLDKQSADTIRCKMASMAASCQNISLHGKLGAVPDFHFHQALSKQQHLDDNKIHPSYVMRFILVIVAVLLLCIVLVIIYCSLYPKYAQRLVKLDIFRRRGANRRTGEPLRLSFGQPFPPIGRSWCDNENRLPNFVGIDNLLVTLADGSQLDQSNLECIGEGYFSKVCRAICRKGAEDEKGHFVAVKIIKNSTSVAEIKQEVDMISKCQHPNIVQYIDHFISDLHLIHLVIEYMGGGDLHRFLINWNNMPTIGDAFSYILQIADGMSYLTEQRIVHRDLAARNCMLDDDHKIVKITDFGLSRTLTKSKLLDEHEDNYVYIYVSENQQQQLPYRWTALECFCFEPLFSEKTDVWAFGVLIWEIFARNRVPYGEKKSQEVKKYLEGGERLEQLPHCPDNLYELMKETWNTDPTLRPTFKSIWLRVKLIFDELMARDSEYMNTQYEPLNGSEYEAPKNSLGPSTSGSNPGGTLRSLSSTVTTRVGDSGLNNAVI